MRDRLATHSLLMTSFRTDCVAELTGFGGVGQAQGQLRRMLLTSANSRFPHNFL